MPSPSAAATGSSPGYLRPRPFAGLLVLLFLVSAGTAAFLSVRHLQIHLRHVLAENRTHAELIALVVGEHQRAAVALLQSYASRPLLIDAVRQRAPEKLHVHLRQLLKENPEFSTLVLADRQGTLWFNLPTFPESHGRSFAHRDWYRGVSRTWQPYLSAAFPRVVGEQDLAVVAAVPIFDARGRPLHILAATQRLSLLARLIERLPHQRAERVTLVDQAGQVLFGAGRADRGAPNLYAHREAIARANLSGDRAVEVTVQAEGTRRHLALAAVGDTGWTVAVSASDREVLLGEIPYLLQTAGLWLLIFLTLAALLLYLRKDILYRRVSEVLAAESRAAASAETLRRREAFIRSVLDHLPIGVAVNSIAPAVVFEYMNDRFPECYRTSRAALGDPNAFWEAVYEEPGFREEIRQRVLADCASGDPERMVWEGIPLTRRGQETTFVSARNIPLPEGQGMVSLVWDVTERHRAEEALRRLNEELEERVQERTTELEAVNRELTAFSYSVSHDLRAPLRGIDGFSLALLEDFGDRLDETGRAYLQRVRRATQQMGRLIDDMLRLSRLTKADMHRETVDLSRMAAEVIETLRQEDPGRAVETEIQPEVCIEADREMMRSLLVNLLGNAWKFTAKTPGARIAFGAERQGEEIVCFVRDNGVGFDMAYAGKLFGAFQRLHSQEAFPGTGIGLATAQRIVHRHGGWIRAVAAPNAGATFYFHIKTAGEAT